MKKNLVIMESATKCESVQKYLGDGYEVITSKGHCIDLPQRKIGVDVKKDFAPTYTVIPGKDKTLAELVRKAKKANKVYLMSDPDREGEAIAWHLRNNFPSSVECLRVKTNEITKKAVLEAFENPGDIDLDLVEAYETRRILDRLVGYKCSYPVQRATGGSSVGRVQSAGLKILAEREKEILNFVPQSYWDIFCTAKTNSKETIQFSIKDPKPLDINSEDLANTILNSIGDTITISKLSEKEASVKPSPPFRTSTLIQAASSFFGMSTKRAMSAAQKLYESGLISYHRTDSINMSPEITGSIRSFISSSYGPKYLPEKAVFYSAKAKNAQEGHGAIRPTSISREGISGDDDQTKLYRLIWARTVASQMTQARYARRSAEFNTEKATFSASGSKLLFDGFRKVWNYASTEDTYLPDVSQGDVLKVSKKEIEAKQTKPPFRYSEASFVKKLETDGIGRPSTYSSIINVLKDRSYIQINNRSIETTKLGLVVIDFLDKVGFCFADIAFTSGVEEKLDDITNKQSDKISVLSDFWNRLRSDIDKCKEVDSEIRKTDHDCPKCKEKLERRHSRFGPFYGCSGYPDCKYTAVVGENGDPTDKSAVEKKELVLSDFDCPLCSEKMVERTGRYGKFYGCQKYPKCRGMRNSKGEEAKGKKKKASNAKGDSMPVTKIGTKKKGKAKRGRRNKKSNSSAPVKRRSKRRGADNSGMSGDL